MLWQGLDYILSGGKGIEADRAMADAMREFQGMAPPDLERLSPEEFEYLGDFDPVMLGLPEDIQYQDVDPRLAETFLMEDSAMNDISVDPRLRENQMASLQALQEIADSGGMTLQDQANLNRILTQSAQQDRGRREAIEQNMAQRGMGGSGRELLAMLDSSQAATDRAAQQSLDIAGMAQQRALDSILQSGQLSGQMRGQEFGEQSQIAAANDAINQFNVQNQNRGSQFNADTANQMSQFNVGNRLNTQMSNRDARMRGNEFNVGAMNQANQMNQANRQQIANMNVDQRNQADSYNANLGQRDFQNRMSVAQGRAGALQAKAANDQQTAANRTGVLGTGLMAGAMLAK